MIVAHLDGTTAARSKSANGPKETLEVHKESTMARVQQPPFFVDSDNKDTTISGDSCSVLMTVEIKAAKHVLSFSWSDFPVLTEDCVYVDSCLQKRNEVTSPMGQTLELVL